MSGSASVSSGLARTQLIAVLAADEPLQPAEAVLELDGEPLAGRWRVA